jgi:hypothetical protein
MAVIIVEDESLLLCYSPVFIKLWESYVTQSDYLLGHDLAGQGLDLLASGKVFQNDSSW